MKRLKFILFFATFAQLSCVSETILELTWEEYVPTGVTKPKRYQIDTNVQDLYSELTKEAIVGKALGSLQPRIDTLCTHGYTLLGSYISDKKTDPNTFSRWVPVKLTIQCNETSYVAFKAAQFDQAARSGSEEKSKIEKAREAHQLLTELTKKCSFSSRKGEVSDNCSKAAALLESYDGPGAEAFRTEAHLGLCISAQKEQGIAAIKKSCDTALKAATQSKDTKNALLAAGILCMGTLDGSACVDAAKSAEILRIRLKNLRLSSRLYEKGVSLLIEECNSKIQISCDKLTAASEECLSTPNYCRSIRLKLAPMIAAKNIRDEAEKTSKTQAEYKEKIDQEYLSLQKAQVELQQRSTEEQINIQKSRMYMEQLQLDRENQRELFRDIQSIFK